jgi:hypothetical protein
MSFTQPSLIKKATQRRWAAGMSFTQPSLIKKATLLEPTELRLELERLKGAV